MATGPMAVKVDATAVYPILRYTVADGTQISRGYILQLSDPVTAVKGEAPGSTPAGTNGIPVGIAAMEKEASDTSTSISVWTGGRFDLRASGAIVKGQKVIMAGQNEVMAASLVHSEASYGYILGIAEETATDQEVIVVRLNIGA